MSENSLLDFRTKRLQEGATEDQIRTELLEAGWSQEAIEGAYTSTQKKSFPVVPVLISAVVLILLVSGAVFFFSNQSVQTGSTEVTQQTNTAKTAVVSEIDAIDPEELVAARIAVTDIILTAYYEKETKGEYPDSMDSFDPEVFVPSKLTSNSNITYTYTATEDKSDCEITTLIYETYSFTNSCNASFGDTPPEQLGVYTLSTDEQIQADQKEETYRNVRPSHDVEMIVSAYDRYKAFNAGANPKTLQELLDSGELPPGFLTKERSNYTISYEGYEEDDCSITVVFDDGTTLSTTCNAPDPTAVFREDYTN